MPRRRAAKSGERLPQLKGRQVPGKVTRLDIAALLEQYRGLEQPVRGFVQEIFERAQQARGRVDEDVYGVLQATLGALRETGGRPPALVFGITHYETGKVEQVGFLPEGMTQIPQGGRFVTNYPGFDSSDLNSLLRRGPTQIGE
ncbi:MAG: hypothetical protein O2954_04145 [bacterium]|nr:hypothetical protein [bacterium]